MPLELLIPPRRMRAQLIAVIQDPRLAAYLREVLVRGMNTFDRQNEPDGEEIRRFIEALKC